MATAEAAPRPQDRHSRRLPFAAWMKRLANLKNSSTESPQTSPKKTRNQSPAQTKKAGRTILYDAAYVQKPIGTGASGDGHLSFSTPSEGSENENRSSSAEPDNFQRPPAVSNRSGAPTLATNPDTLYSDAGQSKAGTSNTLGGGSGSNADGGNSVFSSPNESERSLTTTLTTIQSTAPSGLLGVNHAGTTHSHSGSHQGHTSQGPTQFSHQYPISPASAVPAHLTPHGHPTTYFTATANNLLTDNASILTLASSSKRRRRRSLDTDASVRALAPSSVWGGSRESLPLSVLSSNNMDYAPGPAPGTTSSGIYQGPSRPSIGGFASAERASVYSSSGITAPALNSERNSYYAAKQVDGASVRSGLLGHGRNDSTTNSIGGMANPSSPLAYAKEQNTPGRLSRPVSVSRDGMDSRDGVEEDGDSFREKR